MDVIYARGRATAAEVRAALHRPSRRLAGRCLAVVAPPQRETDVVITSRGVLRGPAREARIDALAAASGAAYQARLAACEAQASEAAKGSKPEESERRQLLRQLAGFEGGAGRPEPALASQGGPPTAAKSAF